MSMPGGNQSVTVEGMAAAESTLMEGLATGRTDRQNVSGEIEQLRSTWTGEAATVFQNAGSAWVSHMDAVLRGLEGLAVAMGAGGQQYSQTHQSTIDSSNQANNAIAGVQQYQGLGV